jgi:hypothetical protein
LLTYSLILLIGVANCLSDLIVRAKVHLSSGSVELEGSPEAVSVAIKQLDFDSAPPAPRGSLKAALESLLSSGFFEKPRSLAEIKSELHSRSVNYRGTSLYPALYKSFLKTGILGHQGNRGSFRYHSNGEKK